MKDRIKDSYKASSNIYNDVMTQGSFWSKLYIKLFWQGVDDNKVAEKVLEYIPNIFDGKLLDVPVGTAIFTYKKYKELKNAKIIGLDYSEDMLKQAKEVLSSNDITNVELVQGDVGDIPYEDNSFDYVLTMNGFHVFPDKDKAFKEMSRVLKQNGKLIACFYIRGKSRKTDWLANNILAKKGWFTKPFDSEKDIRNRLKSYNYKILDFEVRGSIVIFCAKKL
jgi:ubiquinone/menaquinone biosynthesis C-methylase UbiE